MSYQPTTLNTSIPQTSPHPPYSPPSLTHSLSTMNTTATHSTTNTTNPTPTTSHIDTQQNTATVHTRNTTTKDESLTTHILKTLRRYTTLTIPSISTSPRLCPPPPKKNILFANVQFHHRNTCLSRFSLSPIAQLLQLQIQSVLEYC